MYLDNILSRKFRFRYWLIASALVSSLLVSGCGGGGSSSNPVPANSAPLANAGVDQTISAGQTVSLSGIGTDNDGSVVGYLWNQLSGTTVILSNADQSAASFDAPAVTMAEQLVFQLTVTDDDGDSTSDQLVVTVNPVVSSALPAFGPDLTQCPASLVDRGVSFVHVCDCQSGADVSCVSGNDGNAGTAAAPLQTLSAAISAFANGNDVALCRGGSWITSSGLLLDAGACSSASPCTLQDYGDSSLNRPLVTVPQASTSNGLELAPGSDLVHWEGIRINNIHVSKQIVDGQGFGVFVFRDVNDVQLSCLELDGFGIGAYVNSNGIETSSISLSDSYIHDNGVIGWLGGTNQLLIERNRFHNNGAFNASAFQHNVYLSETRSGGVVRGNWLSSSAIDSNGQCVGTSLVAHNDNSVNLLIESNLIEESNPSPACWGLTVDSAGSTAESHIGTIIRGNVVRNLGNVSIGVASCIDCIIENNIVVQNMIGGALAIASPNRPTSAPDADVSGTVVRNNTVYFGSGGSGQAFYVGERGSNYIITNNIAYYANSQAGDVCYSFDLPAGSYDTVANNLCFGTNFDTGTTGMDGMASISDPLFRAAPDDLRVSAGSPTINSGTAVSVSGTDIVGNSRDSNPDRGAYEVQ